MSEDLTRIIEEVEALSFLPSGEGELTHGGELVLLKKVLRLKLAYEDVSGDGPLIAMNVGGTNVGKSTIFNAILGTELVVPCELAGTTKFPVASLPRIGNESILDDAFMPSYARSELTGNLPETRMNLGTRSSIRNGKEGIEVMSPRHFYYTIRGEGDSLPGFALFDAPDIDSITSRIIAGGETSFLLAEDLMVAADLILYVTTPEKYNVLRCMDFLGLALHLGKKVFVFLNKLEGEDSAVPEHFVKELARETGVPKDLIPEVITIPRAGSPGDVSKVVESTIQEFKTRLDSFLENRNAVRREVLRSAAGYAGKLRERVFDALKAEGRIAEELKSELDEVRDKAIKSYRSHVERETAQQFDEVVRSVIAHFSLASREGVPGPLRWLISAPRKLGNVMRKGLGRLFGLGGNRPSEEKIADEVIRRLEEARKESTSKLRKGSESGNPVHSIVYDTAISEEYLGRDLKERLEEFFAPVHDWEKTFHDKLIKRVEKSKTAKTMLQAVDVAALTVGIVAAWLTGGLSAADLAIGPGSAVLMQKIMETLGGKAYFNGKWKELLDVHEKCFADALDGQVLADINSKFPKMMKTGDLDDLRARLLGLLSRIKGQS